MQGKVEICGVNTSKLQTLSNAEMMQLIGRSQQGDMEARSRLVEGNLKLVLSVVQRFLSRGENPDDLFQVGCVGLLKSIDNFDTSMNVRFSTYAVPMIIGEIRRYLRDNNSIRVSRSLRDIAYKALGVREAMLKQTGNEPRVEQIAETLGVPREDVVAALDAIAEPVSLYEPVYRDSGDAIYIVDQLRDEKQGEESWVTDLSVRQALDKLGERERNIVRMRFFQGRTQMEVAQEIGISQAQVSRLEKSALKKMRKQM